MSIINNSEQLRMVFYGVVLMVLSSCNQPKPFKTGMYVSTSSIIPQYNILFNDDSSYVFRYAYHLMDGVSSGKWLQDGNKIMLTSHIQDTLDTLKLPVTVEYLSSESEERMDYVVLNNIDWMYQRWLLIIDKDTLKIDSDTLFLKDHLHPRRIVLMAHPRSWGEIHRLPPRRYYQKYVFPSYLTAQSEPIRPLENRNMKIGIAIDSISREKLFNYIVFNKFTLFVKNNRVKDPKTGVWLMQSDGLSIVEWWK